MAVRFPLPQHNEALLEAAKGVLGSSSRKKSSGFAGKEGPWGAVQAGAFVTVYHRLPPSSEHVWCCMSNGKYDAASPNEGFPRSGATAVENVLESAVACATLDSRRKRGAYVPNVEVTLLAHRGRWRTTTPAAMRRADGLAYHATTSDGDTALFLPSVWEEESTWTAEDLVRELLRKASPMVSTKPHEMVSTKPHEMISRNRIDGTLATLEAVPCFSIATFWKSGEFRDSGFFASFAAPATVPLGARKLTVPGDTSRALQEDAARFYRAFADPSNSSRLAYSMAPDAGAGWTVVYTNEKADARTFADALVYRKLSPASGDAVVKQALLDYPRTTDPAGRLLLLLKTGDAGRVRDAARQLWRSQTESGFFAGTDPSFSNPQTWIALAKASRRSGGGSLDLEKVGPKFWSFYLDADAKELRRAISRHAEFAANWLLQALKHTRGVLKHASSKGVSSDWIAKLRAAARRVLLPVCFRAAENFLRSPESPSTSVTSAACALHGLLSVIHCQILTDGEIVRLRHLAHQTLFLWRDLQTQWALGGFRYYLREPWYRTDVTSHVVAACRAMDRWSD